MRMLEAWRQSWLSKRVNKDSVTKQCSLPNSPPVIQNASLDAFEELYSIEGFHSSSSKQKTLLFKTGISEKSALSQLDYIGLRYNRKTQRWWAAVVLKVCWALSSELNPVGAGFTIGVENMHWMKIMMTPMTRGVSWSYIYVESILHQKKVWMMFSIHWETFWRIICRFMFQAVHVKQCKSGFKTNINR